MFTTTDANGNKVAHVSFHTCGAKLAHDEFDMLALIDFARRNPNFDFQLDNCPRWSWDEKKITQTFIAHANSKTHQELVKQFNITDVRLGTRMVDGQGRKTILTVMFRNTLLEIQRARYAQDYMRTLGLLDMEGLMVETNLTGRRGRWVVRDQEYVRYNMDWQL